MKSLLTLLENFGRRHNSVRRDKRIRYNGASNVALESLESRQLLSIANALVDDGTLIIRCDHDATTASVNRVGSRIHLADTGTGRTWVYSADSIRDVEFHGGDGTDSFANNTDLPTLAYGNGGNDSLRGSGAADSLHGGDGNDRIFGRGGDDDISGGAGADYLHGGTGANSVADRESIDRVFAAVEAVLEETDSPLPTTIEVAVKSAPSSVSTVTPVLQNGILVVRGTENADTINVAVSGTNITVAGKSFKTADVTSIVLVGEKGDDNITVSESIRKTTYIFAGSGRDTVNGGGGTDYIYGGTGDDTLNGRSGDDYIWGGSGTNRLSGGSGSNELNNRPANRTYTMNTFEQEIVRLTNLERTKRGLAALTVSTKIAHAANQHATQMANRSAAIGNAQAHSHTLWGVKLPTMSSRFEYAGYEYSSARENIAYGYRTAAEVVNGWMNSTGHRENILSASITQIGVSAVKNAGGTLFYCQNFGKPW